MRYHKLMAFACRVQITIHQVLRSLAQLYRGFLLSTNHGTNLGISCVYRQELSAATRVCCCCCCCLALASPASWLSRGPHQLPHGCHTRPQNFSRSLLHTAEHSRLSIFMHQRIEAKNTLSDISLVFNLFL